MKLFLNINIIIVGFGSIYFENNIQEFAFFFHFNYEEWDGTGMCVL